VIMGIAGHVTRAMLVLRPRADGSEAAALGEIATRAASGGREACKAEAELVQVQPTSFAAVH